MERTVSFGDIIGATFQLIGGDLPVVFGVTVAASAAGAALDFAAPVAANAMNLAMIGVQYALVKRLVDRQGLRSAEQPGGFGSFFLLGILSGLAIALGFLLLIVPGIYLYARWSMANAILLSEDCGAGQAMQRSWAASRASILPIALAAVVLGLPTILAMVAFMSAGFLEGSGATAIGRSGEIAVDVAANLLIYAGQIAGLYMSVALYPLLVGKPESQLRDVFA